MKVKLQKIGNSVGVIIPKEVLSRHHLSLGDDVLLTETATGFLLSGFSEDTARQLEIGREILSRRRNVLKALAE
jgi:putative addiction module antidote